jgi:hypothetical protein
LKTHKIPRSLKGHRNRGGEARLEHTVFCLVQTHCVFFTVDGKKVNEGPGGWIRGDEE